MRKQLVHSVTDMLVHDNRFVLLLGDIGVHGFRDLAQRFPNRVHNVGILEQATVGMAAGLAMTGYIPIVHTIAPFLVERAYEQLKVDFGYQNLTGLFVSVGGSYDYASLGCTHHCPSDVSLIENIENFSIYVPGNPEELDHCLKWHTDGPAYFRLSERSYKFIPEAIKLKLPGAQACIVTVGPAIEMAIEATKDLPVVHYHSSKVKPFNLDPIYDCLSHGIRKFLVVEPYSSSHLADTIRDYARSRHEGVFVDTFSVPRTFFRYYGNRDEHDKACKFTAETLEKAVQFLIKFS